MNPANLQKARLDCTDGEIPFKHAGPGTLSHFSNANQPWSNEKPEAVATIKVDYVETSLSRTMNSHPVSLRPGIGAQDDLHAPAAVVDVERGVINRILPRDAGVTEADGLKSALASFAVGPVAA